MRNEVCTINGECLPIDDCSTGDSCYPSNCQRIYVGARYVPKVEGFWVIDKDYENFSIVIDPITNNGFTSKKNVPIGVPLTDTEYWVQTFNFSGALEDLSDKFNEYVIFMNSQIGLLSDSIDTLNGKVEIVNKLHEDKITSLENEVKLINEKLTAISDSLIKVNSDITSLDGRLTVLESK